jgi:hypothetical protein
MFFRVQKFLQLALRVLPVLLLSIAQGHGVMLNATIDDELGDALTGAFPTYSPIGLWAQGLTCAPCLAKPDPMLAFQHSEYNFVLHARLFFSHPFY